MSTKANSGATLRQRNESGLQDFLDGVLPHLHPGSPDPEQPYDDSGKGESRPLLKEAQLRRIESPAQRRTYTHLMGLMVEPDSRLAREHPTEHSAMVEFVFGAPAGYEAILELEAKAMSGDPLAALPAEYCRAAFERVLDWLGEQGFELAVPVVPTVHSRKRAAVEKRRVRESLADALGVDIRQIVGDGDVEKVGRAA